MKTKAKQPQERKLTKKEELWIDLAAERACYYTFMFKWAVLGVIGGIALIWYKYYVLGIIFVLAGAGYHYFRIRRMKKKEVQLNTMK